MVLTWPSVHDFGSPNRKSVCTIRMSLESGNLTAILAPARQANQATHANTLSSREMKLDLADIHTKDGSDKTK